LNNTILPPSNALGGSGRFLGHSRPRAGLAGPIEGFEDGLIERSPTDRERFWDVVGCAHLDAVDALVWAVVAVGGHHDDRRSLAELSDRFPQQIDAVFDPWEVPAVFDRDL
jgi:hypothetical protein